MSTTVELPFENLLNNRPENANMTQQDERAYAVLIESRYQYQNVAARTEITPLWLLAGYSECTTTNALIFDDDLLMRRTYNRLRGIWMTESIDAWWNHFQKRIVVDAGIRYEDYPEIIGPIIKVFANVLNNLPEHANLTHREEEFYSDLKTLAAMKLLFMISGCNQCPKTGTLTVDHDDGKSVFTLRRTHIRLKNKQYAMVSGLAMKKKESLSHWSCSLCTFLNEGGAIHCGICGAAQARVPPMNDALIKLGMDKDINDLFATEDVIANTKLSLDRVQCILRIYSLWIASPHRSDINIFDLIDVGLSSFYSFKRLLVDYKYLMKNEHEIFGYDGDNDTFVCPLEAKEECFVFNRYARDRAHGDDHALFAGDDQDYRQIFAQQSLDTIHAFIHHSVRINPKEMNVAEIRKRYRQRDKNKKANEIKSKFVTTNEHKFDNKMVIKMEESVDCFMDKVFEDFKLQELENKTLNNLKNAMECDEFETDSLRMDMKNHANSNIILWIDSLFPSRTQKNLVIQRIKASILFLDNLQSQYSAGYRYFYWEYYKNNEDKVNVMCKGEKVYNMVEGNDGYRLMDWYIDRRYDNFKDEMLNNKTAPISLDQWNATKIKTTQKYDSWKAYPEWPLKCGFEEIEEGTGREVYGQFSTAWFRFYGIPAYVSVRISHLMALLFYCNLSYHQNEFTATYRKIYWNETDKSLKRRHSEFYWWGRLLRELVECFGTNMKYVEQSKFFHGINAELLFQSTFFHGLFFKIHLRDW